MIYLAFLILFTFETARGLNDSDIYRTGNNFVSQLVSVEIPQRFSHVRKTYRDITTIQDLNEWLRGPFVSAVFSTKTVDGHADSASLAGSPLGYNKILGAVRVAQLRASEYDCTESMPRDLARQGGSYRWTCYGDRGQFSAATEAREPFGNYSSWDHANASRTAKPLKVHGPFAFDGRNGRTGDALHLDVLGKRTNVNNFISRTWKTYPSPAFAVMLDPTMGEAAAQQVMNDLVRSRYVDLSTKALLVDMAVYNPMEPPIGPLMCVCAAGTALVVGGVVGGLSRRVVLVSCFAQPTPTHAPPPPCQVRREPALGRCRRRRRRTRLRGR